ncbi:glycoside hydrolase family 18 protein [Acholeplasma sp. OttesenSCG-928-E16]|nr:glycoside hydrolase family 18 protein [Acholeplasma sp. OttesenSCG-928-E16]
MNNKIVFTVLMSVMLVSVFFGCFLFDNSEDKKIMQDAYDQLEIAYKDGDEILDNKVTKDISLLESIGDVSITWTTSDDTKIALDGTVTRGNADEEVTLLAKLEYKSLSERKTFILTVVKKEIDPDTKEILDAAYDLLDLGDVSEVEGNITFPDHIMANDKKVDISWASQNLEIIKNDGTVSRDLLDEDVTVIATLSYNGEADTKNFIVHVVGTFENTLITDYISNYANNATKDSLPNEISGIKVEWTSTDPIYNINNNEGTVVKQYQGHQIKTVTIKADLEFPNLTTMTVSKTINVAPVLYEDLPNSPVATYFSTGVTSSYKTHSERYKKEGTIFSETTKEVLDIIYYAFGGIAADTTVSVRDTSQINDVMPLKNHDVRVVLCISGVSKAESLLFAEITASATKRASFVTNIMNLLDRYGFDGVDIDWESVTGAYVIESGLTALLKDLRAEMTKRQAAGGTPYYLSVCVPSSSWGLVTSRYNFPEIKKYVNYINLMSYDMNNGAIASHLAPVYSSSNDKGYGFGVDYGVQRMISMGLPASQIIIGGAGYGKAYKVVTGATGTYPALGLSGTLTKIDGVSGSYATGTLFGNGIQELLKTGKYSIYHEYNNSSKFVGSYLYSTNDGIFVTYDSQKAITEKYKYISSTNGQGMMFWCYGEDPSDIIVDTLYEEWQKSLN